MGIPMQKVDRLLVRILLAGRHGPAVSSAAFWQYSFVIVASDGYFLERSRGVACTSLSPLPSAMIVSTSAALILFAFAVYFWVLKLKNLAKWRVSPSGLARCVSVDAVACAKCSTCGMVL